MPSMLGQFRLLPHDRQLDRAGRRVVGADLRRVAILQRRDDATPAGVVLGVGARDDEHVQRQSDVVSLDLDVALLHHVEQRHLDLLRQIGKLVDAEDPAVASRQHSEVHGVFVREMASLGHLDRIDVADQVGDRDVRRGELLAVAIVPVQPFDLGLLTLPRDDLHRMGRDGRLRVVRDLAARHDGHPLVEQPGERADHARLRLSAFTEQDHVVATQQRVLDRGHHRLVVAQDARKERPARAEVFEQVAHDLFPQRPSPVAGCPELSEGAGFGGSTSHGASIRGESRTWTGVRIIAQTRAGAIANGPVLERRRWHLTEARRNRSRPAS